MTVNKTPHKFRFNKIGNGKYDVYHNASGQRIGEVIGARRAWCYYPCGMHNVPGKVSNGSRNIAADTLLDIATKNGWLKPTEST